MRRAALLAQAVYYIATGAWSLVHYHSFERITGPKTDTWLVKTVGSLVMVIGSVLLVAALRRPATLEIGLLARGSAAVLAAIDCVYVARRRISAVYLLDAVAELVLLAAGAGGQRRQRLRR